MAMKKGPGSKRAEVLPQFDPDKYYRVRLSESVKYAGRDLPGGARVVVLGRVAQNFEDKIADANEFAD